MTYDTYILLLFVLRLWENFIHEYAFSHVHPEQVIVPKINTSLQFLLSTTWLRKQHHKLIDILICDINLYEKKIKK